MILMKEDNLSGMSVIEKKILGERDIFQELLREKEKEIESLKKSYFELKIIQEESALKSKRVSTIFHLLI